MGKFIKSVVAAAILSVASLATAGPSLVTNGDFEAQGTAWDGNMYFGGTIFARSGDHAAFAGCYGDMYSCLDKLGDGQFLRQSIATSAGAKYDLSLWVSESFNSLSGFSVFWDGALVDLVLNPANDTIQYFPETGTFSTTWKQFTLKNLTSSSANTTFEVHGMKYGSGIMLFDDISVVQVAAADVPEPTSLALLGIGALALMRRRTRK